MRVPKASWRLGANDRHVSRSFTRAGLRRTSPRESRLVAPTRTGWDVRHVEMAVFMLTTPTRSRESNVRLSSVDAIVEAIDDRLAELAAERPLLEAARRALVG